MSEWKCSLYNLFQGCDPRPLKLSKFSYQFHQALGATKTPAMNVPEKTLNQSNTGNHIKCQTETKL